MPAASPVGAVHAARALAFTLLSTCVTAEEPAAQPTAARAVASPDIGATAPPAALEKKKPFSVREPDSSRVYVAPGKKELVGALPESRTASVKPRSPRGEVPWLGEVVAQLMRLPSL